MAAMIGNFNDGSSRQGSMGIGFGGSWTKDRMIRQINALSNGTAEPVYRHADRFAQFLSFPATSISGGFL